MKLTLKILFTFILSFSLIKCNSERAKPQLIQLEENKIPTQESWNDTIYFSRQGKLQAILFTAHLIDFSNEHLKLLDSVYISFYDKNQFVNSTLKSEHGKIDERKNEFTAIGKVILNGSKGRKLLTERLTWNSKTEKIYSDTTVKIFDNDEIIEGNGFISDKKLENYVIRNIFFIKKNITNAKND